MTDESTKKPDFRKQAAGKRAPRAAVDAASGLIIATADIDALPKRVFDLFTTAEIQRWWGHPDFYHQEDFKAELRVCGPWSVATHLTNGGIVQAWGEFAEIDAPGKLVMTRRFDKHPLLGERETTITYRFDPIPNATRVTVRDEGFIGRREAAYGNADVWEKVLGWLDAYVTRT
jgi:uncharacterized protein YndB with AHSA1/START domain